MENKGDFREMQQLQNLAIIQKLNKTGKIFYDKYTFNKYFEVFIRVLKFSER